VGAGEIVASDGYIVTNDRGVRGFERFAVTLSTGQTIAAQLVVEVPQEDLPLLEIAELGFRPSILGIQARRR
jgi:S1-C subfamily serine protease